MNKKSNDEIEEILNLAREEKLNEQELLKQSIEEKNKIIEEQRNLISDLENKNKDLYRQILSLKAEFDNFRKRSEKEKQKKFFLGKVDVLEKIISLYEMFSYAVESIKNIEKQNSLNSELNQIIEGIKLLYKEFENFFVKENIKKIDCLNKKFDHLYHEVVEYEETNEKEDGTIIEVISPGYMIINNDEEFVLRPAKVKVVKNKLEPKKETESEKVETKDSSCASNENGK
ncbi:MAG: nucleotide exchange factor GrpE [Endomicrobiia bacterium]